MTSSRRTELGVAGKSLALPCFLPSVSSVKTNLSPLDYVDLMALSGRPWFLVSAYDIARCAQDERGQMDAALRGIKDSGSVIVMDSGNYESYWKEDRTWDSERFHEIAGASAHDVCFCYDNQNPSTRSARAIASDVIGRVLQDQSKAVGTVAPIIHGVAALLPEAVRLVAQELCPILVAVPERELGEGIVERMCTVRRLRESLDSSGSYVVLHLLGTGNPVSIIAYTLAGADTFDGLEWCQTIVDHDSGRLTHFEHWDFFRHQTTWGQEQSLPYVQSALMHNLWFYDEFMRGLHDAVCAGELKNWLRRYASPEEAGMLTRALDG